MKGKRALSMDLRVLLIILPTCFGSKHTKTVVPEAAGNQEATVDGCYKAVRTDFQHLAKVVAQMASADRIAIVVGAVNS